MARPRRPVAPAGPRPEGRPRAPAKASGRRGPAKKTPAARPRRGVWAAAGTLLVLLGLGVAGGWWLRRPHPGRHRVVRVTLRPGDDAGQVTRALWEAGVIDRPWLFHPLAWVTGAASRARRGELALRDDLSPWAVLRALRSGRAGLVRVTLPEGFTRFDIARRLEAAGVCGAEDFLRATERPAVLARHGVPEGAGSVEGMLFPETYDLAPGTDPEALVDRMVGVFHRRIDALAAARPEALARAVALTGGAPDEGPSPAAIDPGLWALVTLASLVERETGHPDDRPRVAAVFWNRLTRPDFRPRLLQSDPTVRYGCLVRARRREPLGACAAPDGSLRRVPNAAMLADASNRWNTYRHPQLPPSPIANPGARSLAAAFSPAPTDDLYFVAGPAGASTFATTLADHQHNVRVWRATQSAPRVPPDGAISPTDAAAELP